MSEQEIREQMLQYNRLFKEMDDVYHSLAKHYGFSDCGMWILYMLRESDRPITQSKLSEQLLLSKQTVNSALKKLEETGVVRLISETGSHKNKRIYLTEAGEALARRTVDRVFKMEQSAFGQLSTKERDLLLRLSHKYTMELQRKAEQIITDTNGGGAPCE